MTVRRCSIQTIKRMIPTTSAATPPRNIFISPTSLNYCLFLDDHWS
jgi:hypothetical protein